jgi:hypothetical protein
MTEPAITHREDMRLEELKKSHPDPRDLSNKVAGTSEETAALFNSPYKPESELGIDPRSS